MSNKAASPGRRHVPTIGTDGDILGQTWTLLARAHIHHHSASELVTSSSVLPRVSHCTGDSMRNRVEENNKWFKGDQATDIGNPEKRRPRGYAYNALCGGAAGAVSNMRRIVAHIHADALVTVEHRDIRARRRTDIDGKPLQRLDDIAA